ncbi:glucose-6-phosphate isomerase [Spiractinospora alimapuensis]|uniref:glucose-6-phosphate isomerase n=1 Tax=Spiractinospora alimapuensis TaxID=2820884 RepID=UPI001F28B322|nr:glucose-6-phosphate isomerase [Spiractinospora alimapuensis]QVQ55174.1 glucose-6-phosphate isomerase [Spiractinospora alimapuensis]
MDTEDSVRHAVDRLVSDDVPERLVALDDTLWGPEARDEASIRLGWLDLPASSQALLPRLLPFAERKRADGIDRVVLAGMGGSSLAPEVIAESSGHSLIVLDSTDPQQVRRALDDGLERTVVVVSSKSGGTIETDSQRRAAEQAFRDAGIAPAERIVCVTDPGSPLAELAETHGYTVFLADPHVGGRYSALSAFGLVPAALAGVEVQHLLDEASALQPSLRSNDVAKNPALLLGAALGASARAGDHAGRDKVALAGVAPHGLGDWIEQLLAESTGKDGRGLLPVVVEDEDAPGYSPGGDRHLVSFGTPGVPAPESDTVVTGPLGAQFLAWEYATAIAGRVLGVDPFDQPNVAESKNNTTRLLESAGDAPLPTGDPLLVAGAVEVYASRAFTEAVPHDLGDLSGVLRSLAALPQEGGYLAVMAYLDRGRDVAARRLRPALAERGVHPVTFGWGPRFLHSTGQYHKGGPQNGVFLQVTGDTDEDLAIPGRGFGFARLQMAQALGDFGALAERDRPVVRVHLRDRVEGMAELLAALESTA